MDIAYELGGLAAFIAILLIALSYGGWRAGWFSRQERARTDGASLETQRRGQGGQQGAQQRGGWQGGTHTRPDDITRGV
jgi:hypothetical protein